MHVRKQFLSSYKQITCANSFTRFYLFSLIFFQNDVTLILTSPQFLIGTVVIAILNTHYLIKDFMPPTVVGEKKMYPLKCVQKIVFKIYNQ